MKAELDRLTSDPERIAAMKAYIDILEDMLIRLLPKAEKPAPKKRRPKDNVIEFPIVL
jgi:hypothetical protein